MKKLNVAIIGCGAIGSTHAQHYSKSPYGKLTAFVDIIPERARSFAEQYGGEAYEDYRKMLKDPSIDAVSVCLPNVLHAPVTIAALKAGKHVLCEKPIAISATQAESMSAAAKAAGKTLAIGVVNRYNSNVNWIRDMIAAGDLGEVYHVHTQFRAHRSIPGLGGWFTTKEKSGGGVMVDWGVHFIDLIMYCLGVPQPLSVSGVAHARLGAKPRDYAYTNMWAGPPNYKGVCDVEEAVSGLVRTSGPSIAFEGAWAQNIGEGAMLIDFLGEKAGIRLTYGGSFTVYSHKDGRLYKTEPSMRAESMFQVEIDSFLQSAASGKPCASDIDAVIPTQKVLDAFYRSAKAGREVKI
ncbi:MAG: Gfo/Idh/MocA family oxidoreductase [Lentisphaerae bacterium]|jgi:predicted dehydrogenase|nr:Gfo/Idh/MocA family oxidoreductase [Lentisphaerota bacterium]